MASRSFFGYDPYDYYYALPYGHPYRYYSHYPARSAATGFFPAGAEYLQPAVRPDVRRRPRSASVPVRFVGSESEPEMEVEVERAGRSGEMRAPSVVGRMEDAVLRKMAPMAEEAVPGKKAPTAEEAAVRVQAAARGFLARRMVREVRSVEAEAEGVARKVASDAEALRGDARGRIAVGETLMRLLLRLDAVHGAREYRRKVTKRVLALQDAVDALEPKTTAPVEEAYDSDENEMKPESPRAAEHGVEAEPMPEMEVPAPETVAEMGVDGGRATSGEAESDKPAELVLDGDKPEQDEEAESEWEMVTGETTAPSNVKAATEASEDSTAPEARHREHVGKEKQVVAADGLDMRKVMEMVAALCERSAQQCAVISALAARVDSLERVVRRVEETDRRRRRNKKLKKEGKGSNKSIRSGYID
ncbi:hypothetical protein GUJ93_ZPchr0011g28845 [Zizania palustris]|uniref:BAG domain-containing protein n=1 Tax=Zizania palustris TaxID=103762 RepID=A0A8J5WJ98_ZIZPA|nr:hypothetical protein GUJ93_ZPchr0011g28845 [Zizania palustris]